MSGVPFSSQGHGQVLGFLIVHRNRRLGCTTVITSCPSVVRQRSTSPLKPLNWMEFNETWLEARCRPPLQGLCFWADRKNKMAAQASDWLRHFRLFLWNWWTEFNETWHEARSQCPLPSVCFRADRKNKMDAPTSDWLRRFRLLWNRWTEFNETWHKTRSQPPLSSLCFSGWYENKTGRSVKKVAHCTQMHDKHKLGRGCWNLASCKVLLNSVQRRRAHEPKTWVHECAHTKSVRPSLTYHMFDFSEKREIRRPRVEILQK